ncbi:conserved Plasmodium protein, unknown function [Plasmodium gallinaceum]|uniref:Uncharacterized protein n=1 Tax=Plasmodium gallinaceum TaxID=5849 RepID=A0A1J1GLD0_PLAGA|nr:conserved Plasmodium protein, unknown function [Plasmodium gallinaceum]CRG93214.1 conserved Plasmodium protein, unknown function [Plasmodium gallinaceum]
MIVNNYKKPKRVCFSVYYNKGFFYGKRYNYNGYNRYKNYYNYYKLQNYKKNNHYELYNKRKETFRKTGLLKGNFKKSKLEIENKNIETQEKKKGMNKKKCIIKILKRPTEIMKNEETINNVCDEKKEENKETKEKKKKNKKTKTEKSTSVKKSKEGFKFSSTQELFNLLLKDVKENSIEEIISSNKEIEDKEIENQREYTNKRNKNIKIDNTKKANIINELKVIEEKNNIKDNYEIKKDIRENNFTSDNEKFFLEYINNENDNNNNNEENTTKNFYISVIKNINKRYENDSLLLNDKSNKNNFPNNINLENNSNKSVKMIKNSEKNYYNKIHDNYLKPVPSKSLYSLSYPNLLNHTSKEELCKNNSLKYEETKKSKKEEDANLFVIPLYMRSPKPEQIPIPIYLSEDGDKNASKEEINLKDKEKNDKNKSNIDINVRENISNVYKDKITNTYNGKTRNCTRNLKEIPYVNMNKENSLNIPKNITEKKKKKTYLNRNFVTFNLEQKSKLNYDSMNFNMGNMKKNNQLYNSHSYMKTSGYNGYNQNKNGKNFKVDKFFYNKKYKVKTNFNDNQKNKNFHFLKDVKIAVY